MDKAVKVANATNEALKRDGLIEIRGNTILDKRTGKRWLIVRREVDAVWVEEKGG